jgi:hypothetical protein
MWNRISNVCKVLPEMRKEITALIQFTSVLNDSNPLVPAFDLDVRGLRASFLLAHVPRSSITLEKKLSCLAALAPFSLGVLFAARPLGAISMSFCDVALAWHV